MAKKAELVNLKKFARERSDKADASAPLLRDQAYQLIRADIIQCRLRPGEEISEASLVQRYEKHDFGKAPIRAALSKLSQDGLVLPRSRRGYLVVPITTRYVQEMYELRLILEPAAAQAAVGHVDIANLRRLCADIKYPDNFKDNLKFLETHHQFHVAIARASGNERLTKLISDLLTDMERLIHFSEFNPDRDTHALNIDREVQQRQHTAIIDALAAGDREKVTAAIREHVEHSAKMTREAVFASRFPIDM